MTDYFCYPYGIWMPKEEPKLIEKIRYHFNVRTYEHMSDILYIDNVRVRTPFESGSHPCYGCGQCIDNLVTRCSKRKCYLNLKKSGCCIVDLEQTKSWIHEIEREYVFYEKKRGVGINYAWCKTCHKKIEWLGEYEQSQHIIEYLKRQKKVEIIPSYYKRNRTITGKLRHILFKKANYKCEDCGASKEETSLEIDHIIPWAKGGQTSINNLQVLCKKCNRSKHTRIWIGGEL